MIHLHIGTDSFKNRRVRVCSLKVDVCYLDTFLSAPTSRRNRKHTNCMRGLATPNHARSQLPHNFVHYRSERLSCSSSGHIAPSSPLQKMLSSNELE